jgi:hypothetical protein
VLAGSPDKAIALSLIGFSFPYHRVFNPQAASTQDILRAEIEFSQRKSLEASQGVLSDMARRRKQACGDDFGKAPRAALARRSGGMNS